MKQKLDYIKLNWDEILIKLGLNAIAFLFLAIILFQTCLIVENTFEVGAQFNNILQNISHKIDGAYKNDAGNIWYNEEEHIWVESVTNNIVIGDLAGDRNIIFGVKNIMEEYLQESGYLLTANSKQKIKVQLIFLDVVTNKKNISVIHKNEQSVVIRMKATLYYDDKKIKEAIAEESSSEVSMSTLIIDEGGGFNQTSLSNAIKKTCGSLVTKLLEKK
jgi:uncharacterized lipoprotein YajG